MSVSNDMEDWTENKCIQLIREFRKRPFLWDQKHNAYYRKVLKPAAWEEISKIVGMSEFCCRHKIGILLSSFRREKAKTINSRKTGDPAKYYYSSWFGFKYMAFLLDKKSESERRDRIEQGIEEDELDEPDEVEIKLIPDDDADSVDADSDNDNTFLEEINSTPSPEPKKRSNSVSDKDWEPKQKQSKRKTNNDTAMSSVSDKDWEPKHKQSKRKTNNDTAMSSFHYASVSPLSTDCEEEITHFSKYIAAKMKKYNETTKNAVQQAICELLFKADMAKDNFQSDFIERHLTESDKTVPKPFDIKISFSDSE